jgi:serine/threonine-protein kinase ULK/ATG1
MQSKKPLIILKDYKLYKIIGQGSFGKVYLTMKGNDPKEYATKCIDFNALNKDVQKYLKNEIELMKNMNHPNVIRLIDEMKSAHHYYVIMEYCNGGTLSDCLRRFGRPFPIEVIQYFMRQIVAGLKYLHSKRIIHRDIKLDNILVNFKNKKEKNYLKALLTSEVKIIDFGLAIQLAPGELAITALGSPINMDPLILEKYNKAGGFEKLMKYNEKADIWSLGTICYEMFTGETLFQVDNLEQLIKKAEEGNYSIPINIELSNEFISFLNAMLQQDLKKRYSAEELSNHDFLVKDIKQFTKPNYDLIANKIHGVEIIINSKENDTLYNIFNKKKEKENKEYDLYIDGLLSEYTAVNAYFKENNLDINKQEANKSFEKIINIKTHYELGNSIYLKDLPRPIYPEFIYGYSTQERNTKYNEILAKLKKKKSQLETDIISSKLNENKINSAIKQEQENNKNKLEKLNDEIKEIENNYNDIWAPAPKFISEEKDSEKIYDYNLININTQKTDNKQENLNLVYSLKSSTGLILHTKEVSFNHENKFSDKWTWKINSKDWAELQNYYLKIENSKSTTPFKTRIAIDKIKNGKGIAFNIKLLEYIVKITFIPQILIGKKYLEKEIKEVEDKLIIYPPFKGKSPYTEKLPKFDN